MRAIDPFVATFMAMLATAIVFKHDAVADMPWMGWVLDLLGLVFH